MRAAYSDPSGVGDLPGSLPFVGDYPPPACRATSLRLLIVQFGLRRFVSPVPAGGEAKKASVAGSRSVGIGEQF